MATIIPNIVTWSIVPQKGTVTFYDDMNVWLGETNTVVDSWNIALNTTNIVSQEINDIYEQIRNADPTSGYSQAYIDENYTKSLDTLADLRALNIVYGSVKLSGYHTKNDGAFGDTFYRLKGLKTSEVDNGGTIIVVIIAAIEYVYELQYEGDVNVKWFGAKSDGISDPTAIFATIVANYDNIFVPAGDYNGIFILNREGIRLRGEERTRLIARGTDTLIDVIAENNTVEWFELDGRSKTQLDANSTDVTGTYGLRIRANNTTVKNIKSERYRFDSLNIITGNNNLSNILIEKCYFGQTDRNTVTFGQCDGVVFRDTEIYQDDTITGVTYGGLYLVDGEQNTSLEIVRNIHFEHVDFISGTAKADTQSINFKNAIGDNDRLFLYFENCSFIKTSPSYTSPRIQFTQTLAASPVWTTARNVHIKDCYCDDQLFVNNSGTTKTLLDSTIKNLHSVLGALTFDLVFGDGVTLDGVTTNSTSIVDDLGTSLVLNVQGKNTQVVERASNANGVYIKYSDGTMIAYRESALAYTPNVASGAIFASSVAAETPFPIPFVGSTPIVTLTTEASSNIVWGVKTGFTTLTGVKLGIASGVNGAAGFVNYIAIGRWK